jgi:hypothetical protein
MGLGPGAVDRAALAPTGGRGNSSALALALAPPPGLPRSATGAVPAQAMLSAPCA